MVKLPPCPRCGSGLSFDSYLWITNVLGISKPKFICEFCGWTKTKEQVQKDGGLNVKKHHHKKHKPHSHHKKHHRR